MSVSRSSRHALSLHVTTLCEMWVITQRAKQLFEGLFPGLYLHPSATAGCRVSGSVFLMGEASRSFCCERSGKLHDGSHPAARLIEVGQIPFEEEREMLVLQVTTCSKDCHRFLCSAHRY